jgi:hypothetical protein
MAMISPKVAVRLAGDSRSAMKARDTVTDDREEMNT